MGMHKIPKKNNFQAKKFGCIIHISTVWVHISALQFGK